jgi:hypothetical protein
MKRIHMICCFWLIGSLLSGEQVSKTGTTAASFLNIDVGAQAIGMGGAYVAIADGAIAQYWNSAGIARLSNIEVSFSHTRWIAEIALNYAALAVPMGNHGTVGVNVLFLNTDDMERTTILHPDGTGEMFSVGSYALGLCYARNLTDRFSVGTTVKYIQENIYHSKAQGMAFDVGTLFDTQFAGLKIGMNISNYGTKMQMSGRDMLTQTDVDPSVAGNNDNINANLQTEKYDLPLMFRVGISMDVLKGWNNSNLILGIDALHPNDDVEYLNVGAEYMFNNMLALRAGYKSMFANDSEEGISIGGGIQYHIAGTTILRIDYAYHDFGVFNEIQMFSLGFKF